jgi:hypothetical protein
MLFALLDHIMLVRHGHCVAETAEPNIGGMEMRRLTRMFTISAVLVLGLVAVGAAQMMGGSQGHMMTSKAADTTSVQGNTNLTLMMDNMSSHYQMMNKDFDKLEANYNQMMKMNDMQALKTEMKKQQQMVKTMHMNMGQQESMLQNMMTMMHYGNQNMMGQNMMEHGMTGTHANANNSTGNKDPHPKDH